MSFKDRSWEHRFQAMGDEAESKFEEYAENTLRLGFVRYGLARPPIQMHKLPKRLCYTPDYLMSTKLVEVQGVGRDQKVKLKHDKLNSLRWWNDFVREGFDGVHLFIWDSHKQRMCMFHLSLLDRLLADGKGELGSFPEGKPYISWDADDVFEYAGELNAAT